MITGLINIILGSFILPYFKDTKYIIYEKKKTKNIEQIIEQEKTLSIEDRIVSNALKFVNTPYGISLIGSKTEKEVLVANLDTVDCSTLVDYVLSLSISKNKKDFVNNLIKERYNPDEVKYIFRNHFMSDLLYDSDSIVRDITPQIPYHKDITKLLNRKNRDETYVDGIPIKKRRIYYIPTKDFISNQDVFKKYLHRGDIVGFYTNKPGLDVSHMAILIDATKYRFIHASSSKKKVVIDILPEYLKKHKNKGLIIYRVNVK